MRTIAGTVLAVFCLFTPVSASAQTVIESNTAQRPRDVIFVPTREAVATAMMKLAGVTKNDVVYDLGCGDGALVIAAAQTGCPRCGRRHRSARIKEATDERPRGRRAGPRHPHSRRHLRSGDQDSAKRRWSRCTCCRASTRN